MTLNQDDIIKSLGKEHHPITHKYGRSAIITYAIHEYERSVIKVIVWIAIAWLIASGI